MSGTDLTDNYSQLLIDDATDLANYYSDEHGEGVDPDVILELARQWWDYGYSFPTSHDRMRGLLRLGPEVSQPTVDAVHDFLVDHTHTLTLIIGGCSAESAYSQAQALIEHAREMTGFTSVTWVD